MTSVLLCTVLLLLGSLIFSAAEPEDIDQYIGGGFVPRTKLKGFEYQTLIRTRGATDICGGAYIGSGFVLTTASCVSGKKVLEVIPGTFLANDDLVAAIYPVSQKDITIHPLFAPHFLANDIAIINIRALSYSGSKDPGTISISSRDNTTIWNGENAWISGFGATEKNADFSPKLTVAEVALSNIGDCSEMLSGNRDFLKNILCSEPGVDICKGDEGGPLVYQDDNRGGILIGLMSFSIKKDPSGQLSCLSPLMTGTTRLNCTNILMNAYTAVGPYFNWIQSTTGWRVWTKS